MRVLSKILFYLLQDGSGPKLSGAWDSELGAHSAGL